MYPLPDNPISSTDEDVLGWTPIAENFAHQILRIDASQGLVVGLFGSWGSGKTSFINLAGPAFTGVDVLKFNPWIFSGADQLVWRFFSEISAAMEKESNAKDISKMLRELGLVLANAIPSLAALIGASNFGKLLSIILKWILPKDEPPVSAIELRNKLTCALEKREKPIVVVLDDVDRLSSGEIRELFKLVRLTASFPNVIYIVACDRTRVENALQDSETGYGPNYLEKVFQWSINVPTASRERVRQQLLSGIEKASGKIEPPFSESDWPDIEAEIILPLVRNMRDVRRFSMTVRGAVDNLGASIALVDSLALEAIRLFMPDLFQKLPGLIDVLTVPPSWESNEERMADIVSESIGDTEKAAERRRARLEEVVEALDAEHRPIARALIHRVFSGGCDHFASESPDWAFQQLKDNRVVHRTLFRLYLTRVEDRDLACSTTAKRVFEVMHEEQAINERIRSQDSEQWAATLVLLWGMFNEKFERTHAEPALSAFWDLLSDMPKPRPGAQDEHMSILSLLSESLLKTLLGSDDAAQLIGEVVYKMRLLTSKVAFATQVSAFVKKNKFAVSDVDLLNIETRLNNQILSANADELAVERHPARVLLFSADRPHATEASPPFLDHPKLAFALLWDCQLESSTTEIGSRSRETQHAIHWNNMVKLYGDWNRLKTTIQRLDESLSSIESWIVSELCVSSIESRRLLDLAKSSLD